MKQQNLEQRIVAALSDDSLSACALADLIGTTESAITAADAAAEAARVAFFDPIQTPDIHTARDAMEATQHVAARLGALLPRLKDKWRERANAEERAKWKVRYDVLERERNELAAELKKVYPVAVSQLVDLFNRIMVNEAALSALHGSRPAGAKGTLLGAELVARNLTEGFNRDQPPITRDLKLPDWVESNRLAWPPASTPASVLLSESIATVHDRRRYSGEWPEALREETEQRKAQEQKLIADEAVRVAAEKAAYERALPR